MIFTHVTMPMLTVNLTLLIGSISTGL